MGQGRRGVYPGSFNPPTVAHLAIARQAVRQHGLDVVVWAVSRVALAKQEVGVPTFDDRLRVLRDEAAAWPWLDVVVTDRQLVAEIADGYDLVVMGADKWEQIHDVRFYADEEARDRAIASLPVAAVAPRAGFAVPPDLRLEIDEDLHRVSSSAVRAGARDAMSAAARRFDDATGAWTDEERYRSWQASQVS